MIRSIAKAGAVIVAFLVVADVAEHISRMISGTPTNELGILLHKSVDAQELAARLGSKVGCSLLTAHSEWILFVYLPIAAIAASFAARALRVSNGLAIGIVSTLFVLRLVLMVVASRAMLDLVSISGCVKLGAGVSPMLGIVALLLSILLSAGVLYIRCCGNRTGAYISE